MTINQLELRLPPAAVFFCCAAAMWLTKKLLPGLTLSFSAHLSLPLSVILYSLGSFFCFASAASFWRAKTTLSPIAPDTTTTLITWGIYRISRNPIYTGMLFILAGWSVRLHHLVAFVFLYIFIACLNRFQIQPEERALAARFGPSFEAYRNTVRRWL